MLTDLFDNPKIQKILRSKYLYIALFLIGIITGFTSYIPGDFATPPLGWYVPGIVFIFSVFAIFFILSMMSLKNDSSPKFTWYFFFLGGIYSGGAGLASLVMAIYFGSLIPEDVAPVAMTCGLLIGLAATKKSILGKTNEQIS